MAKRPAQPRQPADQARSRPDSDEWRLFLAIPLPDPVKERIREIRDNAAVSALPLRLVDPDHAHVTLHFLGATPAERAELLSLALSSALSGQPAARLETSRVGFFPNERKPRVFWLGLAGETDRVAKIHEALGRSLASLGFDVDRKPFRPHVTIGRVRDGSHPRLADDVSRMLEDPALQNLTDHAGLSFAANEIQLIRSHLEKTGPRYEVLRSYPLEKR